MCRAYTIRGLKAGLLLAAVAGFGFAQAPLSGFAQAPLTWKNVGGTNISADLAGPASGAVSRAWYSPTGDRLSVVTQSGRVFETGDFEQWRLGTSPAPAGGAAGALSTLIGSGPPRILAAGSRLYAAGADNIYASDDSGRTWLNLTGFNNRSILGGGFNGLAVSPASAREITAVNKSGVWRSLDGGLSWTSLNRNLPNFAVRRFAGARTVLSLEDGSLTELSGGHWIPATGTYPDDLLVAELQMLTGRNIAAVAERGSLTYAGTAEGQLLVARSGTPGWHESTQTNGAAVSRIWADEERPEVALAAAGQRLLRTINGGLFWDDVTGDLPAADIHGITADRLAGVVYVATARGVWSGNVSLNAAGPVAARWVSISRDLPAAAAWDVRLNADNSLSVALDGYGVFETAAPHKSGGVRILNAADLTARPAAPGSLISVIGAQVREARGAGALYPVIAAAAASSQIQVPFEAVAGNISLALEGLAGRWTVPLAIRDASPAIFVDSEGAPLLLDAESGLVMDPGVAVHAGSSLGLLATGLGRVTPDWPSGVPAPMEAPPKVRGNVTAYLDGTPLEVTRATLAPGYVGYYVIELRIPAIVNRGAAELRISTDGAESNRVRLYVDSAPARQ